ncbi:FecCD family ABC transporter permease [Marinilactibacillus psychrotolerans]|uniref:FecCD family ABC transporter permease n=2 Tax=Marinilactibacillus psychrotolerans TaxID=191770 RepID=A0ABW8UFX3_9LACT|nr:iron ABC transporter permease [Marinilactibacillus psychrotolerans]GEQ32477.1 iron ABC transporter permease protein [Marinilactibacillus psychrotolerans]SJN32645.1 ABC-type Fe3+-siderophore transport system, permease 2 component [Marinilactibacillus psychrotolerans 42ea]
MNLRMVLTKNYKSFLFFLLLLIVIISLFSLVTGYLSISLSDIWSTITGEGTKRNQLLLIEFRLPRLLVAILAGASLGVAGTLFQGVTQNELADPGIIGINSGAGLAVVLFLTVRSSQVSSSTLINAISLPVAAFIGGLIAAVCIYMIAWKKGITPIRMLLVGIGINAGFGALLTMLQLRMNERDFNQVAIWLSGSIWNAHWPAVFSLLPWTLLLIPISMYKARTLNILQLGDQMAVGLGVSLELERAKLVTIGVALAGVSVSVAGGISFLGLGAPHIARKLIGNKHERLLPVAACIGALILLISDILARNLLAPAEVPVGIIVSILGAPYFLYLLVNSEN